MKRKEEEKGGRERRIKYDELGAKTCQSDHVSVAPRLSLASLALSLFLIGCDNRNLRLRLYLPPCDSANFPNCVLAKVRHHLIYHLI